MSITTHGRASSTIVFSSLVLVVSLGLGACGEGVTNSNPGTLTVVNSFPTKDQLNVGLKIDQGQPIRVTVQEALDPVSINGQNVHLMPAAMGDMDHEMTSSAENADMDMLAEIISGTTTLSADGKTIQFVPNTNLSPGTRYHFHISGVKLAGGKVLATGTDTIEFFFTTAHSHEIKRVYYDTPGVNQVCVRKTAVENMERIMREYTNWTGVADGCAQISRRIKRVIENGGALPITTHYKRGGHMPSITVNGQVIQVENYTEHAMPSGGTMVRTYEQLVPGVGYVDYDRVDHTEQFLAEDWWSEENEHGSHMISYQWEVKQGVQLAPGQVTTANAKTDFELDNASLMEMNHQLQVPQAGMYPHRHIFYQTVGANGKIDFDAQGNPTTSIDDVVRVYHTREYDAFGKRTRDWTFRARSGTTITFDPNLDEATRVRVYKFDTFGNRVARFSYEGADRSAKTRAAWEAFLNQPILQTSPGDPTTIQANNVEVHDYRTYQYDFSGNLSGITVYHECEGKAGCPAIHTDQLYGQFANMAKEQERQYSTQPTVPLSQIF